METKMICPPVILILDDGVHVFRSVTDAEQSQETLDLRTNPTEFGYGYDSSGQGIRLKTEVRDRRILGLSSAQEHVVLDVDSTLDLLQDVKAKSKMAEYLLRRNPSADKSELEQQPVRELLHRVLNNP